MTETRLQKEIEDHPYPLLFVSLSGAHLYGFPRASANYALHGVHVLPASEVLGLKPLAETVERSFERDGLEMGLVTDDVKKFFQQLQTHNGFAIEQVFSPVLLCSSAEHETLKEMLRAQFTRHHSAYYLNQAQMRQHKLEGLPNMTTEALLQIYRILMTGLFLMQEGEIESNLVRLSETYHLPPVKTLLEQLNEASISHLHAELSVHKAQWQNLTDQLCEARDNSLLPQEGDCTDDLNELLLRIRFAQLGRETDRSI